MRSCAQCEDGEWGDGAGSLHSLCVRKFSESPDKYMTVMGVGSSPGKS